jgi:hypothetical protein
MTLTPQDRETIERARSISGLYQGTPVSILCDLLAILDRLAAEEKRKTPGGLVCKICGQDYLYHKDHTANCPRPDDNGWLDTIFVLHDTAPSSPLPAAICARCGKRYDNHQGEFCTCGPLSTDTFLPAPDKPEQDEPENCPEFWQKEINKQRTELEMLKIQVEAVNETQNKRLNEIEAKIDWRSK